MTDNETVVHPVKVSVRSGYSWFSHPYMFYSVDSFTPCTVSTDWHDQLKCAVVPYDVPRSSVFAHDSFQLTPDPLPGF